MGGLRCGMVMVFLKVEGWIEVKSGNGGFKVWDGDGGFKRWRGGGLI